MIYSLPISAVKTYPLIKFEKHNVKLCQRLPKRLKKLLNIKIKERELPLIEHLLKALGVSTIRTITEKDVYPSRITISNGLFEEYKLYINSLNLSKHCTDKIIDKMPFEIDENLRNYEIYLDKNPIITNNYFKPAIKPFNFTIDDDTDLLNQNKIISRFADYTANIDDLLLILRHVLPTVYGKTKQSKSLRTLLNSVYNTYYLYSSVNTKDSLLKRNIRKELIDYISYECFEIDDIKYHEVFQLYKAVLENLSNNNTSYEKQVKQLFYNLVLYYTRVSDCNFTKTHKIDISLTLKELIQINVSPDTLAWVYIAPENINSAINQVKEIIKTNEMKGLIF